PSGKADDAKRPSAEIFAKVFNDSSSLPARGPFAFVLASHMPGTGGDGHPNRKRQGFERRVRSERKGNGNPGIDRRSQIDDHDGRRALQSAVSESGRLQGRRRSAGL